MYRIDMPTANSDTCNADTQHRQKVEQKALTQAGAITHRDEAVVVEVEHREEVLNVVALPRNKRRHETQA